MTLIAGVLLTDRKPSFPVALEYLVQEPLVEAININIQTNDLERWRKVADFMVASGKPFVIDYWKVMSSWINAPQYDQDPARFAPIAMGRNMVLDWAIVQTMMNQAVSHILFVDSDVRPHAGGLQRLLDLKKPLTGGLVPGRGAHSSARYVFGNIVHNDHLIRCDHGTSGYLLMERSIFEVLRFRAGPCIYKRDALLCDDPAMATDSFYFKLADGWYIDDRATADHVDDPAHPLTMDEAINNYHAGGSSA